MMTSSIHQYLLQPLLHKAVWSQHNDNPMKRKKKTRKKDRKRRKGRRRRRQITTEGTKQLHLQDVRVVGLQLHNLMQKDETSKKKKRKQQKKREGED